MPVAEIGAFLLADEAATAFAADQMATAAFADVGMGTATSALGAGLSGETIAGLMGGGAGGVASLPGALTGQLANISAVNPEIAAQVANAANAAQIPSAGVELGTGQMGSAGLQGPGAGQIGAQGIQALPSAAPQIGQAAAQGAGGVGGLQAGSFAQQIPTQYQTAMSQLAQGAGQYPGTQLASVGNAGVSDALARGATSTVAPAAETLSSGAPTLPIQNPAFTPPVEGMLDAATGRIPETPGLGGLLSKGYEAWQNSNPFIKYGLPAMGAIKYLGKPTGAYTPPGYSGGPLSKFTYSPDTYTPYTYRPYAAGGPVEEMSRENALGANTGYPQADIQQGAYATPWQTPVSRNVVTGPSDANVDQMTGEERMAGGGIASLGSYSDGGRLLRGPGDGMSDGIPATISGKQPARLADGEFVVPADVVSGLGNGSTDAGAKHLYSMMDKVRRARTGTKKQGREINPRKYLPA